MNNFESSLNIFSNILDEVVDLLKNANVYYKLDINEAVTYLNGWIHEDVARLVSTDPAAQNSTKYVTQAYKSVQAVMGYRVAHYIYTLVDKMDADQSSDDSNDTAEFDDDIYYDEDYDVSQLQELYRTEARKISEHYKAVTSIEIHPAAKIGHGFVIDHGADTVIGETCEIGDNCTLLQGVVLGASGIAGNKFGKRHPTLGNNVQVAACARILGNIRIGDNVIINAYCVVTSDVPDNCKVSVVNQLQIMRGEALQNVLFYGGVPQKDSFVLLGDHLDLIDDFEIVNLKGEVQDSKECKVLHQEKTRITLRIESSKNLDENEVIQLRMKYGESYLTLTRAKGWDVYVSSLRK